MRLKFKKLLSDSNVIRLRLPFLMGDAYELSKHVLINECIILNRMSNYRNLISQNRSVKSIL